MRTAQVLFALECSLGEVLQAQGTITGEDRYPDPECGVTRYIEESYIDDLFREAVKAYKGTSTSENLEGLYDMARHLDLFSIRNAVAHPNRPFPTSYWYRIATIATDARIQQLGFTRVQRAFEASLAGDLDEERIPEDWVFAQAWSLPNNLPRPFEHNDTGLLGRGKDHSALLKLIKGRKHNLIAIIAPGGTGKTAIALEVLDSLCNDPDTLSFADATVFLSAKTEKLTHTGPTTLPDAITCMDDVRSSIAQSLSEISDIEEGSSFEDALSSLGDQRIILCIDNLETLLRDNPAIFDAFYDELPDPWRVVVTSRIPVSAAKVHSLQPLDQGAAENLVQCYLRARGLPAMPKETASAIAAEAQANPLAIRIVIDAHRAGVPLEESRERGPKSLLDFSFSHLLKSVSSNSLRVLECLFVSGDQLTRSDLAAILARDLDEVAMDIQPLVATSLINRAYNNEVELIELNSSIRELFQTTSLDPATRDHMLEAVRRHRTKQQGLVQDKSLSTLDPLHQNYIPEDANPMIKSAAIDAFRAARATRRDRSVVALQRLRSRINDLPGQPVLARAHAALLMRLKDPSGALQSLQGVIERGTSDAAARLMAAHLARNQQHLDDAHDLAQQLMDEGWAEAARSSATSASRVLTEYWVTRIWQGHAAEVCAGTQNWQDDPDTKCALGCVYSTALRRRIETQNDSEIARRWIQEVIEVHSDLIKSYGYSRNITHEALKFIDCFENYVHSHEPTPELSHAMAGFVAEHLNALCTVHRQSSLENPDIHRITMCVSLLDCGDCENPLTNSPLLTPQHHLKVDSDWESQGYVLTKVVNRPLNEDGSPKPFLFSTDKKENYFVGLHSASFPKADFDALKPGDSLYIISEESPRQTGKARRAIDAQLLGPDQVDGRPGGSQGSKTPDTPADGAPPPGAIEALVKAIPRNADNSRRSYLFATDVSETTDYYVPRTSVLPDTEAFESLHVGDSLYILPSTNSPSSERAIFAMKAYVRSTTVTIDEIREALKRGLSNRPDRKALGSQIPHILAKELGRPLDARSLGFERLADLLKSMPDVLTISRNTPGDIAVQLTMDK